MTSPADSPVILGENRILIIHFCSAKSRDRSRAFKYTTRDKLLALLRDVEDALKDSTEIEKLAFQERGVPGKGLWSRALIGSVSDRVVSDEELEQLEEQFRDGLLSDISTIDRFLIVRGGNLGGNIKAARNEAA